MLIMLRAFINASRPFLIIINLLHAPLRTKAKNKSFTHCPLYYCFFQQQVKNKANNILLRVKPAAGAKKHELFTLFNALKIGHVATYW